MNAPAADVAVVGAGIVGAACAFYLASEGLRVQVIESNFAGGGVTAAGMGHLVAMDDSPAQLALTSYSLRLWNELRSELPPRCELTDTGTIWIAEDAAQMEIVGQKRDTLAAAGVEAEIVGPGALALLEPNLRPGLAGGLLVPGDRVLYPPAAARALLEAAIRRGATVSAGCRAVALEPGRVVTDAGTISADAIVNAAGPAAAELTEGLPILPRKGHLVITDRAPGFCRHQLVELGYLKSAHTYSAASVAFNVQPRATGQVLVGSSREFVGEDASINRSIVARMLARAASFLPALAALPVIRVWTGFRPATPDKLPLVGRSASQERVWIAAGHEGLGITTATATGRICADLILGRTPEIDPTPFSPNRAGLQDAVAHA